MVIMGAKYTTPTLLSDMVWLLDRAEDQARSQLDSMMETKQLLILPIGAFRCYLVRKPPLPKAVGFFPYQTYIDVVGEKKKELVVESKRYAVLDFKTVGNSRYTDLHFDVWGYNTEKQTTVVIERNGLSYPLFGSGETRFLSPDSSFSSGITFMAIINDLEKNKIAKLNEMIYGKKGFDYWIDYNKKKKDETELKIEKMEYGYSALHTEPVGTDKKSAKKAKKSRKHIT